MTFYILAAGCQMNLSDAERIRSILEQNGYREAKEEEADLLGVVACSVRQQSIDKIYGRIKKWNEAKKQRPLVTFLTGCVLDDDRKKFLDLFDLVFETKEALGLPEMVSQYGIVSKASGGFVHSDFWHISPDYASSYDAFIPIQNGCNNFCAYCAVPYTRGREVSRDSAEILSEYENLLSKGYKSMTLLGQNVNSYGQDRKGGEIRFAELLDRLGTMADAAGHRSLIYYTAPHPKDMTVEVLEVMARHSSIAKQLHLPLQSGSDRILGRMNRRYTREDYGAIVKTARGLMPDLALFTDIIVGFPGETEEDFKQTREAFQEYRFLMAYIARYSPRPGAVSAEWSDDIDFEVKKRRLAELSDDLKSIAGEENRKMVGRILPVLVTGTSRDGKLTAGISEGRVNVQFPESELSRPGMFRDVTITEANGLSLSGQLSSSSG